MRFIIDGGTQSLVIDGRDSKFHSHHVDGGATDGKCDHHHQTEPTNETDGVSDGTQMPIESDRNQQQNGSHLIP
ncbi:unnamed protein product [Linum trigynum]|uniref:Uncharacterized protein n=1 Tax=Linum trigynum TaxID=586398 RepID=A0AAV2CKF8_9ROSI